MKMLERLMLIFFLQLKLTFSTQFGLSEPYSGGHKLGMGLEFSPWFEIIDLYS